MVPSYETIEDYQWLIENAVNQNFFFAARYEV